MVKNDSTEIQSDYESINRRQQRITELTTRLDSLFEQADNLPDTDSTKQRSCPMNTILTDQQPWDEMNKLFRQIDAKSLAMQHIQDCQCKLVGYYGVDDRFYEEIVFNYPLAVELEHFSIGEASDDGSRWMKLKYILKVDKLAPGINLDEDDDDEIGEFSLIFDPKLNFVDEYWFIDVNSPFIIAKRGQK